MNESYSESYARAGVDVTAGYETVNRIRPLVESTYTKEVLGGLGGFGGMFELTGMTGMKRPVAVSGTDGVGTKLKIAFLTGVHNTIGIDCVAMCVNDIVCSGAKPLFFLDYVAMGKNIPRRTEQIVSGIAQGCRQAGCALIGGETAEMPGLYSDEEYDLAGFSTGIVDFDRIIDGSGVCPGDQLIGLPSSGLHSNGFSLVRKVLGVNSQNLSEFSPELGKTLGEELLTPTRIYVKTVLSLLEEDPSPVKSICHITGGGFYENIPRCLPEGIRARVEIGSFPVPPIFNLMQSRGSIPQRDMYNTFNMGIGLVLVVSGDRAGDVMEKLARLGQEAFVIGRCAGGEKGVDLIW